MDRVIVNEGTKVNLYNLFEDLQDYSQNNFLKVIDLLIESYGVNADTAQDGSIVATDTSLKVTAGAGGSADYVNIAPGEALTSGLHYISINTPATFSLVGLSTGWHYLYLKHKYTYSDPVDVMSGFAIGLMGGSQKNSRVYDSYEFIWDTNPTISGIALASVIVLNGAYEHDVEDDLRPSNVLKLKNAVLSEDVVRKSETGTQVLLGSLTAPAVIAKSSSNTFTITSGTGTNTLTGTEATTLKTQSHVQNTDTYTSASTFYVGGDVSTGHEVITLAGEPMKPLNFRITDIDSATKSSMRDTYYIDNKLALSVKTGLISHDAMVSLAWNWDECSLRTHLDPGKIRVKLSPGVTQVNANDLVGYHLWLPNTVLVVDSGIADFVITANDASESRTDGYWTTLTVDPYEHTVEIDDASIDDNNINAVTNAWIHSNAERYDVVAIPTRMGTEVYAGRHENIVSYFPVPAAMRLQAEYPLGESLELLVRAASTGHVTHYTRLFQGSFTKPAGWKSPVTYSRPVLVEIPEILSTGAQISAVGTSSGFKVQIEGWNLATDYEVVWNTSSSIADFNDIRAYRTVSSSRTIDISTSNSALYYVKVRPLISGQAVAAPLSTQVMSGTGGQQPVIYSFGPVSVNLKTYSGTLSTYDAGPGGWLISGDIYSPAGSVKVNVMNDDLLGETITIDGVDYTIGNILWEIANPGDVPVPLLQILPEVGDEIVTGLDGKAFTIGTSELAREVFTGVLSEGLTNVIITSIDADIWALPGVTDYIPSAPIIRVYPINNPEVGDTLVLGRVKGYYTQTTDIPISLNNGNMIVKVDLYDPAVGTNSNKLGVFGQISLHYKAKAGGTSSTETVSTD